MDDMDRQQAGRAAGSWIVVERVIGWMRPGQIRSAPAAPARDLAAVLIAIQTCQDRANIADGPNRAMEMEPCPSPNPSSLTRAAGLCA
jgi:hypothetical protein